MLVSQIERTEPYRAVIKIYYFLFLMLNETSVVLMILALSYLTLAAAF